MQYNGPKKLIKSDEATNNASGEDFNHQIEKMGNISGQECVNHASPKKVSFDIPFYKPSQRRVQTAPTKASALSEAKNMNREDLVLFQAPVCKTSDRRNTGGPRQNAAICATTNITEQDLKDYSTHVKKNTF